MYAPRDWPQYINTWGTTFLVGPFLFPALAGYICAGTGSWRDAFKVLAGFYGLSTILILLFGRETFYNKPTGTQQTNRVKALFGIGNTELPKGRTLSSSTINIIKLIFTAPILLVGLSTMVNFTWPIGITTTIDGFVRSSPYLFNDVQDASIRFAGVIGALLGFVFGYFFNEWIYNGSGGKRKAHWRSEYRLHGVWLPIGSMVFGLLTYGLTLNYGKSWVGLAIGWVMVNIGLVGSTVAITAFALEKYPNQAAVVSAIINMWRTSGGFAVGYFQPSWITKNGVAAVFATQAAVVAIRCLSTSNGRASGHNRWSKIRHDKGANDKVKSREHGGADPSLNSKLAIAIANAKRGQLSKSSIESAIAKGQGKSLSGAPLENVTVEAMLPHGVAAMIEYQTESKAKVLQDIRALISRKGGSITPTAYMFERKGKIWFRQEVEGGGPGLDVDHVLEEAIEAGATDVMGEDGQVVVETEPADVMAVSERLQERLNAQVERVEIIMEAKQDAMVDLDTAQLAELEGLIETIEDEPSLQNVYMDASESLQSWQEAFEKHSIVETRSIEKQLRLSIANDKGRLRNLVGDNYRELLGTADRIVLLDKQTREAERQIYEIGQQCQPPVTQHDPSKAQLEKLRKVLLLDNPSSSTMVDTLYYLLESLQVIKNLAGRTLLEALGNLQKQPIWESQPLQSLEWLDLKSLVVLLPEELRSFTPFFKRTPLAPRDVQQMLEGWADEARILWLSSLKQHMFRTESGADLLQLRQSLYTTLLPLYFSTPGRRELFQAIRKAIEGRMHVLATNRCVSLSHVVSRFEKYVRVPQAAPSLWQPELAKLSLNDGGQKLIQQVWSRYTGRPVSQAKALRRITRWISSVEDMQDEFDKLRNIRWREHLEDADDEQDDEAQAILDALAQKDPVSYTGHLQQTLVAALGAYEEKVSDSVEELGMQGDHTLEAVSLLRITRDSLNLLRRAFRDHQFEQVRAKLPHLYGIIANGVVARLVQSEDQASTIPPASSLDDVPSPRTFAFIQKLCAVMLDVGNTDIWSADVVNAVQRAVTGYIFQDEKRKHFMETSFDEDYIRTVLGQRSAGESRSKAADAYWARTKLLFGVLAPQS
ncbi:hypothetical protein DV737_g233, partial [Chaetothyriales sp. CBS 132003]